MELYILLIVYGLLFLGELGDKTQLIVFNLALEHKKAYKVGIGATMGFAIIVTLSVFIGAVITTFIPIILISIVSGIIFIFIGLLEARDLKESYEDHKDKDEQNTALPDSSADSLESQDDRIPSKFQNLKNNPYLAGFGFIFLMELGDKSQILTITLASIYPHPLEVWLGSFLALTTLVWMGVFFGSAIAKKVPKFHLKLISVILFIFIGILILLTSF